MSRVHGKCSSEEPTLIGTGDQLVVHSADAVLQNKEHETVVDEEKANGVVDNDKDDLEIRRLAWGRRGTIGVWIGIALMWIVFELDYTIIYNYQNYAASDFREISSLGAITTAGTITSAVLKPPMAKISEVIGRAETYVAVVVIYIVSYVLCASARSFGQYAAGFVLYNVGQAGLQTLNQIIVADITSSRMRGLANGLVQIPYLAVPFAAAFITDAVLSDIGWRWGIGMFAIITPICSMSVIGPLFLFQHRLKRLGVGVHKKTTIHQFCSKIDLGGSTLLITACAMILLPLSLAGGTYRGWATPWTSAVLAVGAVCLVLLVFYERSFSRHPIIPPTSLKNVSLVLACLLGLLDSLAYQVTHTYLYAFVTTVYDFAPRNATFLTYTAGCLQVLFGLVTGYLMYKTKRYKWLVLIGVVMRLFGYGVMIRLRRADSPVAELFIVQVIQGIGSGVIGTVVIVVAQVVVPRDQLAQTTGLILLFIYMGNAIGAAIAGGIYTNLFKKRLTAYLGSSATRSEINKIYNSITEAVSALDSQQRQMVNFAYADVFRYMTIAALVASAIPMIMVWFLPNLKLGDEHSLVDQKATNRAIPEDPESITDSWLRKWTKRVWE